MQGSERVGESLMKHFVGQEEIVGGAGSLEERGVESEEDKCV